MSDQTVTLRITAEASGVGPAAKAAAGEIGKIGESATGTGNNLRGMGRSGAEAGEQVSEGAKKGAAGLRETVKEAAQAQLSIKSVIRSAAGLAGIFGAGFSVREMIGNTIRQEQAFAQLEARIRSTGGAAGLTAPQLASMASGLQNLTTYGDEVVMEMQSLLLTFTQIGGPQFERAQRSILDMATAMGSDLKSAALQVGKALNDPAEGLSALSRSGIQFSEDQETMIKRLVETGRVAEAQGVILEELERQFGGAAEAARGTFGGAISALKNVLGDLLEGKSSLPEVRTAIEAIVQRLQSPEVAAGFETIVSGLLRAIPLVLDGLATVVTWIGRFSEEIAALTRLGVRLAPVLLALWGAQLLRDVLAFTAQLVVQAQQYVINIALARELGIAQTTGFAASLKSIGLVNAALGAMVAAFAGWQIGTWLREEFEVVAIAGNALVTGVMQLWTDIEYGAKVAFAAFQFAGVAAIEAVRNALANLLDGFVGMAQVELPMGLRADFTYGASEALRGLATELRTTGAATDEAAAKVEGLREEWRQAELANMDMMDDMMAATTATFAQRDASQAATTSASALTAAMPKLSAATKAQSVSLRDQVKAWNESLRAQQTFRNRLEDLRAEMGGPLAKAQLQHKRDLAEIAELARVAGASTEELTEYQERLNALYKADTIRIAKEAAGAIKDAAKEMGRTWKDVLSELEDTPFKRLLKDIELVGEALEDATDPNVVARLEAAMVQLQGTLRDVQGSLGAGIVDASMEALRGAQSLTEHGSRAFKQMQVAIDALALVQGISAILNQGTGDPYSAPVRMMAMAAAIAPLIANLAGSIGAFGGSSGFTDTAAIRQERQGTGTVLGDAEAKSESIQKSLDIIADATSQLPGLSRSMVRALEQLQGGIDRAGGMLARGADATEFAWPRDTELNQVGWGRFLSRLGDPIFGTGLLGRFLGGSSQITDQGLALGGGSLSNINLQAYEEQQYRSWRFGSRRTREQFADVGADFEAQFQLIVDSLVETVRQGALALGVLPEEIEERLQSFVIEATRISLKDLSAEEKREEILAVFSAIFDDLAGDVVPFISQFQRLGEGLGETLVRVATGVLVTREGLLQLGFALDETDPERFAQISEGLIDMVGGIEEFISGMTGFVDSFAPEAHKFGVLQDGLNRAFAEAGLVLPATREGMWELMQSLDATTEAGRRQIATLLRLTGSADAYYTMLERNAEDPAEADNSAALAEAQRIADLSALMERFRSSAFDAAIQLAEFDMSPLQRELAAIDREMQGAMQAASALGASEAELAEIRAGFAARSLLAQRRAEESLNQLLDGLRFDDALAGMSAVEQQIARNNQRYDQYIAQAIALGASEAELAEIRGIQVRSNERIQSTAQAAAASIGRVGDQLAQIAEAGSEIRGGLTRIGDDLRDWINQLTGYSPEIQDSASTLAEVQAEIQRRFMLEGGRLDSMRGNLLRQLAEQGYDVDGGGVITPTVRVLLGQLAAVDVALEGLGDSILELEEYAAAAFLARQRAVLEGLREWRDSLLQDTQLSVLTPMQRFADIERQYLETLAAAQGGDVNAQQALQGIAQQYLQQAREMFASSEQYTDIFARVLADTGALIEGVLGEGDSVADAIQALADAPIFAAQVNVLQSILDVLRGGSGALPSYDVGTAYVPRTGPALIHAGEMIVPASVNAWAQRNGLTIGPASGGNNEAVVAELRALREQQQRAAEETARRLERVEKAQREGSTEISREQRRTGDLLATRGR